jgi:hypothetical protein
LRTTWLKAAFAAPWLLVLGWGLLSDFSAADGEMQVLAFALLTIADLPISMIFMGIIKVMDLVVSHELLGSDFSELWSESIFMSGERDWFKLKFFLWWLVTFTSAFWQWFYLLPRMVRALRPWMERG